MKVVLLNIKYSPNLGDGVIAECFEAALRARLPAAAVESCDLAGRTDFTPRRSHVRRHALKVFALSPPPISRLLSRLAIAGALRWTLKPYFEKSLKGADVVVIGGGQLFADANLNFPAKMNAALAAAKTAGARVAIHAVGVETGWSSYGAKLFKSALFGADLCAVSVRDDLSQKNWRAYLDGANLPAPTIAFDPAFLSALSYDLPPRREESGAVRPNVGLCVTASQTLALHARRKTHGEKKLGIFFSDLAEMLRLEGFDVTVFTNGAADDEDLLQSCFPAPAAAEGRKGALLIAPRAVLPRELVATIAGADAIVGHRLHANIIAFALGVPHVGLAWNRKVDAFFTLTGRSDYLLSAEKDPIEAIVRKTKAAMAQGLDAAARRRIVDEAGAAIDALARVIRT